MQTEHLWARGQGGAPAASPGRGEGRPLSALTSSSAPGVGAVCKPACPPSPSPCVEGWGRRVPIMVPVEWGETREPGAIGAAEEAETGFGGELR